MRILLFGTGDYYQKYKKWFRDKDIVALIDNDSRKQGRLLDGHKIVSPKSAVNMEYDRIYILSVHEKSMRGQLKELGADDSVIFKFSEIHKHPEILAGAQDIVFYGKDDCFARLSSELCSESILLMSHNLDLNGAALALFYAALILKKAGYQIYFASWTDGELRKHLLEERIPVIIDANLQIYTQKEIQWIQKFHRIFCNTLNYYQFLSERNGKDKVIWWLHDPELFYESLDMSLFNSIAREQLRVFAVGPISERAFRKYVPGCSVRQLIYGIPDCEVKKIPHEKIEFITVGNVQAYKGQDVLISAIQCIPKHYREKIHFRIIGSQKSAFATKVKEKAKQLGDLVTFYEPVDRVKIHDMLNEADVLVCPSRIDTMSIASNEAMQHAIPCIVSDTTGVAAYIEDGKDGIIVKSEDYLQLAEKIKWCVDNKDEVVEMGRQSRKIYERYFSLDIFEKNLLEIVSNVYEDE